MGDDTSAHLVTLVSLERALLFGRVVDGHMVLNEQGTAVAEEWQRLPNLAAGVRLGAFMVMPNHLHGILSLRSPPGAKGRPGARTRRRSRPSEAALLGSIVTQFKAAATRRVNALRGPEAGAIWQPGYRDLAIEDGRELEAIRRLVEENPARWAEDVENPDRLSTPSYGLPEANPA